MLRRRNDADTQACLQERPAATTLLSRPFPAVADEADEGRYILDAEGRLIEMNRAAESMLGWSARDARHLIFHDLLHAGAGGSPIHRVAEQRDTIRVADDVFIRRDGTRIAVTYDATPCTTPDGEEGCVVVFQDLTARRAAEERLRRTVERRDVLDRLRDAILEARFVLHAQPIIDIACGRVVQHELLIRLPDAAGPDGEPRFVPPSVFIPIAEEHDLIIDIDRWVVDRAASLCAGGTAVEVNVSARSITDAGFMAHVREALRRTGADPAKLVFEITETALLGDEERAMAFIQHVHDLGCKVALDDFGTGYGGFLYLKRLPVDCLKIDIEFVRDLCVNAASHNVVEAVVSLARGFGLETVAEGVEDADTLERLRQIGVDQAQGYYIGRPAPLD